MGATFLAFGHVCFCAAPCGGLDHRNSGLPRSWIYGLAETGPPGRPVYWISASGRGLARWEAGTWKVFSAGTPLENAEANLVLPTSGPRGTALWVGTSQGLFRWEGGRWTGAGEILLGLPASEVLSLLESRTPAGPVLWVGTRAGLARCAAGDTVRRKAFPLDRHERRRRPPRSLRRRAALARP